MGLKIDLQPGEDDPSGAYWTVEFGNGSAAKAKIQDGRAVNPNNWYHLVTTFTDGALRFYVDGMLVAEQADLGNTLNHGMPRRVIGDGLVGEVGENAVTNRATGLGEGVGRESWREEVG